MSALGVPPGMSSQSQGASAAPFDQLSRAGIGGPPSPLTMRSSRLVCCWAQELAPVPCLPAVLLPLASSCRTRMGWPWVLFWGSVSGHRNPCPGPEEAVCRVAAPSPGPNPLRAWRGGACPDLAFSTQLSDCYICTQPTVFGSSSSLNIVGFHFLLSLFL